MLVKWYEAGVDHRPETFDVHSWFFMVQSGIGHFVVRIDSLETIWKHWYPCRNFMDITIEPCLDLDERISLLKKTKS